MDQFFTDALWIEGLDEEPNELRQCLHYSSDTGKLYIVTDDGKLKYAEVRQQLLSGEWSDNSVESTASARILSLQPIPEVDLTATSFTVNRSGSHAVVSGPSLTDPEITSVFILDLTARHHTSHDHSDIMAIPLDEDLFSTHPGLRVLQITWHPDSDSHVSILTSDSTWRLYHISQPQLTEQTFELAQSQRHGLIFSSHDTGTDTEDLDAPVSFQFGIGDGWDRFSVYFLTQKGRIYTLCPVAPFNSRYPSRLVESLRRSLDDDMTHNNDETTVQNAQTWLQRAFQPISTPPLTLPLHAYDDADTPLDAPMLEACCPHALDDHSPVLTGPLHVATCMDVDVRGTSHLDRDPRPWSIAGKAEGFLIWKFGGTCTVAAIASTNGSVALNIVAGTALPRWHHMPPQCIVDETALIAVRMQSKRDVSAIKEMTADRYTMGDARLILVDIIALHPPKTRDGTLALVSGSSNSNTYATNISNDNIDDDFFYDQGQTPGSRTIVLDIDRFSSETLYCILPQRVYSIHIPWLSLLSESLYNAFHYGDSLSSMLPDALPLPRIDVLYGGTVPPGVVWGCSIGDALCGSALVLLLSNNTHACIRATKYASPAMHTEAATTDGNGGAVCDGDAAVTKEKKAASEVQSILDRVYKDVLQGPVGVKSIEKSGKDGADSTAVQRALLDATTNLRLGHIEYIHKAHHILSERIDQVQDEVMTQQERIQRIKSLADKIDSANTQLESGVQREQWMSENFSKRVHLLAELHWALPRPASFAENSFRKGELPALEESSRRLNDSVATIEARVALLKEQQQQQQQSRVHGQQRQAAGYAPVPPHQLRKIREMLAEHDRAIRLAKQQVEAVENALM